MDVTIYVNPSIRYGEIHPHFYGYFLEHTANPIYGGMYDPASSVSDERGFRTDVLEAAHRLRQSLGGSTMSVPPPSLAVIRWRISPHSYTK